MNTPAPRPRRIDGPRLAGFVRATAIFTLAWLPGMGCKSPKGEACRCAADCRDGLVCVIDGREVLGEGECAPDLQVGECADDDSLPGDNALSDMPIYEDLPSKRDLGTGSSESDSGTDTDTDTTTTGTDTDTGTTTGTDTDTGTGTDTTTGTDTGTDTGTTTGTDTGTDTGTTTGTDTGTDTGTTTDTGTDTGTDTTG